MTKQIEIMQNVYKIRYLQTLLITIARDDTIARGEYFRIMSEYHKYEWQMYRYIINNPDLIFEDEERDAIERVIMDQQWDLVLKHLIMFGFEDLDVDPMDPVQFDLALKPPVRKQ